MPKNSSKKLFKRVITLLSDIHIGSYNAVFPRNYVAFKGKPNEYVHNLNEVQEKLLESFEDMASQSKKFGSDTLIILGDPIAGMNVADCGRGMVFSDMDEQVNAFCSLINSYYKHIKKIYLFKGTGYHEAKYVDLLEKAVLKFKCLGFEAEYIGSIANLRVMKEPKEVVINLLHEGPRASVYPETPMARTINNMLMFSALGKVPRVKAIIRGHNHQWEHINKRGVHFIQLPCWQTFNVYEKAREHYYDWQCDIGGVLLLIDFDGHIRPMEFLYELPLAVSRIVEG